MQTNTRGKDLFDLTGLIALVTGGSSGIGEKIARDLSFQGAKVIISGRNEGELRRISSEIDGDYVISDLMSKDGSEDLFSSIVKKGHSVDILVNNAGFTQDSLLWRTTTENFNSVLKVNLVSAFELCKFFSKGMVKNGFGRIINISSIVGVKGNVGQVAYSASKAGLIGMTKTIALEFAARNITVNCIAPGFVDTKMTQNLNEKVVELAMDMIPMKRFGSVSEISSAVAFLSSRDASYITGEVLGVSGGIF